MSDITIAVNTSGKEIYVNGNMFNYKTAAGLYLSSNKFDGTQNNCNFYSAIRSTSAANPPFSGYPIPYTTYTNNTISFKVPPFSQPQKIDIIYCNEAGYVKSSDWKRLTYIQIVSGY